MTTQEKIDLLEQITEIARADGYLAHIPITSQNVETMKEVYRHSKVIGEANAKLLELLK